MAVRLLSQCGRLARVQDGSGLGEEANEVPCLA